MDSLDSDYSGSRCRYLGELRKPIETLVSLTGALLLTREPTSMLSLLPLPGVMGVVGTPHTKTCIYRGKVNPQVITLRLPAGSSTMGM